MRKMFKDCLRSVMKRPVVSGLFDASVAVALATCVVLLLWHGGMDALIGIVYALFIPVNFFVPRRWQYAAVKGAIVACMVWVVVMMHMYPHTSEVTVLVYLLAGLLVVHLMSKRWKANGVQPQFNLLAGLGMVLALGPIDVFRSSPEWTMMVLLPIVYALVGFCTMKGRRALSEKGGC